MIKKCPSFPGYSADDFGNIFSSRMRGIRIKGQHGGTVSKIDEAQSYKLAQFTTSKGYKKVSISFDGKSPRTIGVHQLVADAFIGIKSIGQVVRHLDGNPANNQPKNLAYGSHLDNANDRIIHKRYASGESHSNSKLIAEQVLEIKILRESGEKVKAIADKFQVSISTIEGIIYGKTYTSEFRKVKP